jgi:hypothetical protein
MRRYMRAYRQRRKPAEPAAEQSVDLTHCLALDDPRVGQANYGSWTAGRQIAFEHGIEA